MTNKKVCRRLTALALCFCLLLPLAPGAHAAEEPTFTSIEDGALYLRGKYAAHQLGIIAFRLALPDGVVPTNSQIADIVFAHTGVPTEGDYLRMHTCFRTTKEWYLNYIRVEPLGTSGGTTTWRVSVQGSYSQTAKQEAEVTAKLERDMAEMGLDGMTEYEKIRTIHDYLLRNCRFDGTNLVNTAYGALFTGEATGAAVSALAYRMLLSAGIDARILRICCIRRSFNIVRLGDLYYCFDALMDQDGSFDGFLRGSQSFPGLSCNLKPEFTTEEFHARFPISLVSYKDYPEYAADQRDGYILDIDNLTLTILNDYAFDVAYQASGNYPWDKYLEFFQKIVVCEGVYNIPDGAFARGSRISELSLPDSLVSIGASALGRLKLDSLVIPDNVVEIGSGAFADGSFKHVTIGESIKWIRSDAFSGCGDLEDVRINSQQLSVIEERAFMQCRKLKHITFGEKDPLLGDEEYGVISGGAFSDCEALESITLNCVREIGEAAFYGCESLRELKLNEGLEQIGEMAFMKCESLTAVELPYTLAYMGSQSFAMCTSLERVVFLGPIMQIGVAAFCDCPALKLVSFADGAAVRLLNNTFCGCTALKSVFLPESMNGLSDRPFNDCSALQRIIVPPSVTSSDLYKLRLYSSGSNLAALYYPGTRRQWCGSSTEYQAERLDSDGFIIYYLPNITPQGVFAIQQRETFSDGDFIQIAAYCGGSIPGAAVFAARYDANGRFLGAEILGEVEAGRYRLFLMRAEPTDTVRAFFLDPGTMAPIRPALTVLPSAG